MAHDDRSNELPTFDLEPPPVFEVSNPGIYQGEQPAGQASNPRGMTPTGLQPAQPTGQLASSRSGAGARPAVVAAGALVLACAGAVVGAVTWMSGLTAGSQQGEPPPTRAPGVVGADFGDGTYLVGKDIEPGIYRTPVVLTEDLTWGCYWYIMDAPTPSKADYIASGGSWGGRPIVTLEEGRYFQSDGCLGWALEPSGGPSSTAGEALEVLAEGVWVAGTDILPGTYRASSLLLFEQEWMSCYMSIHDGSTWDYASVVSSYSSQGGHPMITVEPGDVIENFGCGRLTLVDVEVLRVHATPSSVATDGMWLVGVDIRPGTYRTVSALSFEESYEACYARTHEGTRFADDDLYRIERFTEGYAEIRLDDGVVFVSGTCGTWERQGD